MSNEQRVLIVEDDPEIVGVVREEVESLGYQLEHAANGELGLSMALAKRYLLIILDVRLPRLGGLEVCKKIREQDSLVPVMILSGEAEDADVVLGLSLGADDYLTKPFSTAQLRVRIAALLRRLKAYGEAFSNEVSETLHFGPLTIDLRAQVAMKGGVELELTKTEFHVLAWLAKDPGRVFTRDELLCDVLGYSIAGHGPSITPHISRLRSKIEEDPANPRFVLTVRGIGYRFVRPDELTGTDSE
ncbi:MAG: response regulator transcription factor [Bdellovibrionales bacterium]|nr:response regulator transcription factor [Bdellovibrionales bacterium]